MSKKSKGKTERITFSWMRSKSDASKRAWEKRWERGTAPIGPKGQQFIERTFGPTIRPESPGRPDVRFRDEDYQEPDEFEEYDDFDFWDSEY